MCFLLGCAIALLLELATCAAILLATEEESIELYEANESERFERPAAFLLPPGIPNSDEEILDRDLLSRARVAASLGYALLFEGLAAFSRPRISRYHIEYYTQIPTAGQQRCTAERREVGWLGIPLWSDGREGQRRHRSTQDADTRAGGIGEERWREQHHK